MKNDAAPFRKSHLRLTVNTESESPEIYELDVWRKQTENETLTLSHITKPAEDSDLSSLADETEDKDTVLTTYVAGSDQFRETGANKSFFGGVPAEELLSEWGKFDYKFVGEKNTDGVNTAEIEGKLKPGKHSIAAKLQAFFRTDDNLPVELHLFDANGKELRVFRFKNYQTAAGHSYFSDLEIENPIYKSRIRVEVLKMEYPDKIDDAIFTREQLKKNAGK